MIVAGDMPANKPTEDKRQLQTRAEGGFPPHACPETDALPENVKSEPKGEITVEKGE